MPLTLSFVSLRTRFMALAVLLTLAASSIWGWWSWSREREQLLHHLEQRAEMLLSTMSIPVINALLYEELGIIREGGLLDTFIAHIMADRSLTPVYAMVLDQGGRVLAHNRLAEYGEYYSDPVSRAALVADGIVRTELRSDGVKVLDFAAPLAISGKRWGCLRIGVPLAPLDTALNQLATQIGAFALAFSLAALLVFHQVGRRLADPLADLAEQMALVDRGAMDTPARTGRRDEIGLLQENFCRMIDRLRRSEEEREASFVRMLENERLATVGKIVSGVAHEVNNPLAGIQAALYFIDQKGGGEVGRYTGVVQQGVERIRRIVGQLLDLSRPETMELELVDSRGFFEDLALFAKMALKSRLVQLVAEDLSPPRVLRLDRDKIHQVILNLVLNAADAVGEGGVVRLRGALADDHYLLSVHDTGAGIAPELRERIFEPFFTTKEGSGSGMGLAISRGIAESHGGTLTVSGEVGSGTTFTLSLPAAKEN